MELGIPKLEDDYISNSVLGEFPRMSEVIRFQGTTTISKESVAVHSYEVAIIAGGIAKKLEELDFLRYNDVKLSKSRIYEMSLFHDLSEVFAGDIPAPFKVNNPEFKSAYDTCVETYFGKIIKNSSDTLYEYFYKDFDKSKNSQEVMLVKIADILQLISFCYREINLGNKNMMKVYENGFKLLSGYLDTFKKLDRVFVEDLDRVLEPTIKSISSEYYSQTGANLALVCIRLK